MNNVGELTVLHGSRDDVLQLLVGDQLDIDAGLSGESGNNVSPNLGAVSGLDGSDLDGNSLGLGSIGLSGSIIASHGSLSLSGLFGATSDQGQSHGQHQQKCDNLLHSYSSILFYFAEAFFRL